MTNFPRMSSNIAQKRLKELYVGMTSWMGATGKKAKELLVSLYGSSDEPSSVTIDHLRDFVKETRGKRDFTKRADVDRFTGNFLQLQVI